HQDLDGWVTFYCEEQSLARPGRLSAMALEAFGDSKIMSGQVILWQVLAAYVFALAGGSISTSLHLAHKPLCALISFAAGTLLGVTLFAIWPESLVNSPWWAVPLGRLPDTPCSSSSANTSIMSAPPARPVTSTQT